MERQMQKIPIANFYQADRYDTDFHYKLHLWAEGKSYDIQVPKYPDGTSELLRKEKKND